MGLSLSFFFVYFIYFPYCIMLSCLFYFYYSSAFIYYMSIERIENKGNGTSRHLVVGLCTAVQFRRSFQPISKVVCWSASFSVFRVFSDVSRFYWYVTNFFSNWLSYYVFSTYYIYLLFRLTELFKVNLLIKYSHWSCISTSVLAYIMKQMHHAACLLFET